MVTMFVVITPGRSGSTMLMHRLSTHPRVHVQMEALAPGGDVPNSVEIAQAGVAG